MQVPPLSDKVAVVTGASRGIGEAIAKSLARHGASVVLAARSKPRLGEVAEAIAADGGAAIVVPTDVTDANDIRNLVRATIDRWGRLDVLVNNAGTGAFGPLAEASAEAWSTTIDTNARSTFLQCREAIPHHRAHDRSYIVNIASVVAVKGYANQALYAASKHAVLGMSKALAKEVQADGIRVHVINPGGVNTDLIRTARPDLDPEVLMAPEEVADVVLFLVTRQGNAVIDEINMRRASSTPWA